MKKQSDDIQDRLQEIIVKIGTMLAAEIDPDTVRFFAITSTADLPLDGLSKTIFLGSVEETISRITNT